MELSSSRKTTSPTSPRVHTARSSLSSQSVETSSTSSASPGPTSHSTNQRTRYVHLSCSSAKHSSFPSCPSFSHFPFSTSTSGTIYLCLLAEVLSRRRANPPRSQTQT